MKKVRMSIKRAVQKIERRGLLLVFPLSNRPDPPSLWSEFYPRDKMRWEWDDSGDSRVANLWHLREELSRSRQVVYSKWYRGRATLFSRDAFTELLAALRPEERLLTREAQSVLRILEEESPLSTKQLKRAARLEGRWNENAYQKALKQLWGQLFIVGFGEVDDGAFPSLAIGATRLLFEDLWNRSRKITQSAAREKLRDRLAGNPAFLKEIDKLLSERQRLEPLSQSKGRKIVRAADLMLPKN